MYQYECELLGSVVLSFAPFYLRRMQLFTIFEVTMLDSTVLKSNLRQGRMLLEHRYSVRQLKTLPKYPAWLTIHTIFPSYAYVTQEFAWAPKEF